MARPKYRITDGDRFHAFHWIDRKIRNGVLLTDEWDTHYEAEREYKALKKRTAKAVNNWAEKWLKAEDWKQLKNAIRAQRKRTQDKGKDKPKSIVLSHEAWMILSGLANRDEVTLSECLVNRLHKAWLKIPFEGED